MKSIRTALCFGALGLAVMAGCSGEASDSSEGLSRTDPEFSTFPHEPNHEEITTTALGFLRPEVLAALVASNVSTDIEFVLDNTAHFDDCNFSGGSARVAENQAAAVEALDPAADPIEGDAKAILSFGRSIHGLQDFYAHTNWVELGGTILVDTSVTLFPALSPYQKVPSTGFVVVQGERPKSTSLVRDDDAAYPTYAVVTVREKGKPSKGLISGTVDYEAGDFCPAQASLTHEQLNKDQSTLEGRTAQHYAAKSLAIQQTRHEWCRLQSLAYTRWGDAAYARLAGWVADPSTAPDCTVE